MNLPPVLKQRYFDSNGNPLAGGKLYTYQAGTSTPQATYTDSSGGTPNANPVVLDANGEAAIWVDPSLSYKFILTDSSGATQWTVDNVVGLITADAVSTASLQDGAVTTPKLAANAVDSTKLKSSSTVDTDRAVTSDHIRNAAVTAAKAAADLVAKLIPSGAILPYAGASAPTGFLLCDGSAVLRTAYPDLYAAIGVGHGDGTKTNSGGSSGYAAGTAFNVPDYRGRFLRGVDGGAARDPDRASRTAANTGGNTGDAVGSVQGQATGVNGLHDTGHSHSYSMWTGHGQNGAADGVYGGGSFGLGNSGGSTVGTSNANLAGDNETRPVNANVNYIIKT